MTDFYAPVDWRAWLLPRFLRSRRIAGLGRARTISHWPAFALQHLAQALRMPMGRIFKRTDAWLARRAAREAERRGAALYCYSSYVPDAVPLSAKLVVFVYHPLPATERGLLGTAHDNAREGSIDWARADAVVCASSFTARSVIAAGCDEAKLTVIPYGLPRVARATPTPPDGQAEFLFVGQGIARKGLGQLVDAWQRDPPPNSRLTLVCYAIDPAISAQIVHPSIRLLGYVPRAELEALFAAAKVFVMPSLIEGFGLVYLEALAHGCHVIGTPNSGLPDLALGADAVTLVTPGHVAELAAALRNAADRSFDRTAISAAAAPWSEARFRTAIAAHAAAVLAG